MGIAQPITALRALTEHRDHLVLTRTRLINRRRTLPVEPIATTDVTRGLSAEPAA